MIHFNRKVDFYSDNIISSRFHKNSGFLAQFFIYEMIMIQFSVNAKIA